MASESAHPESVSIALVPIGCRPVSEELLLWCSKVFRNNRFIHDYYRTDQHTGGVFDVHRKQYPRESILGHLRLHEIEADKIVGLFDRDCFAAGLNFIFGQATLKGKEAFVALPR